MSLPSQVTLTTEQTDILEELMNISFARTAAALSELARERVELKVPDVMACPIEELMEHMGQAVQGEIATVHQVFSGPMSGDALLVLSYESALTLSGLLADAPSYAGRLETSDREVLIEVGSILLNACLGMFGNLLQIHITFSVPRMHLLALEAMLSSLRIGTGELRQALVATMGFHLRNSAVDGSLIIVLGVDSLEQLLNSIETFA
jgi:chemotaxis protein CheC